MRLSPAHPSFPSPTSSPLLGPWQVLGLPPFSLHASVPLTSFKIQPPESDVTPSRKPPVAHSRFRVSILVYDCLSASNPPSYTPLHDRTPQTTFLLCELNPCWALPIHAYVVLLCSALLRFPDVVGLFFFF